MAQLKKNLSQLKPTELKEIKFAAQYGEFFEEIPVPIREFIDSSDYLDLDKQCRRRIKEELVVVFGEEIQPYHLADYMYALITGGIGIGKCHKKGTKILMYSGITKKVENIVKNDLLMGDDSIPRKVISTTIGKGQMFKVIPIKGKPFVVNDDHILSLKRTNRDGRHKPCGLNGDIVNISVKDYLNSSKYFKRIHKLYRVGVKFKKQKIKIDPYWLGLWLGDGYSYNTSISTIDKKLIKKIYQISRNNNLKVVVNKSNPCYSYNITSGFKGGRSDKNSLLNYLKEYNLIKNKHIPQQYKINSRKNRLQLLAGLIDSDGERTSNCLIFTNTNKQLIKDVLFLARSLGFAAYVKKYKAVAKNWNYSCIAYKVTLSGDLSVIPLLLKRKRCTKRKQIKNVLVTGFKIKKIGIDNYYGFVIDKNNLYLLDDFTVTHNTFMGGIIFSYLVYRLACLKDPQGYYGFAPRTRLAFMNMSHNRNNALDVLFGEVKNRIESSPWFQKNCLPEKKYTNVLKFKKNIYVIPGDSSETTFEGYNIIGGIIDEADSHKITQKKDYAEQGFDTIEIRIKSRANPKFGHIGFLLVIGSKKKQRGFVQRKYDEFQTMDNAHAIHLPIWKARNAEDFKGDFFYFDVFKKEIISLPKGKNPNILKIPTEYKEEFIRNPDKSMRDLAGHPPFARQPYFALAEKLLNLETKSPLQNPVKTTVGAEVSFHEWFVGGSYKYVAHFDLGLNKDGSDFCGFALGHIHDWIKKDNEMKPIIMIDVMLRIEAPPGGEIIIKDLRQIIYNLKEDRKFNIKSVTFDGWQSTETIQQLRKKRIRSEILSVDKDNKCYDDLKDVIYEDRFTSHYYKPFVNEAIELEHTDVGKIDHPAEGSKDVSDAVAAVVYKLISGKKSSRFTNMGKSSLGESRINITGDKLYGEFKKQRNV